MSAADKLNEIEARANAATEGPWMREGTNNECYIVVQESGDLLAPFNDYTENHDLMTLTRTSPSTPVPTCRG